MVNNFVLNFFLFNHLIQFCCCLLLFLLIFSLMSFSSSVFDHQTTAGRQRCCGQFKLDNCTSHCARPSCLGKYRPAKCVALCEEWCVCKDNLLYDECTQKCVEPDWCSSLEQILECAQLPEPYSHCDSCE